MAEDDRPEPAGPARGLGEPNVQLDTLEYRSVVRVPRNASLAQAASALREANVSSVLIGDQPRTLVTERDVVRAFAEGRSPSDAALDVAATTPLWVTTTSTVLEAARVMQHHEVRHLIVIDAVTGSEVGMLSIRDVLSALIGDEDGFDGLKRRGR